MTTTTPATTIKFIKQAKFNTYMFVPLEIKPIHTAFIQVKHYKKNKYIFIPTYMIECDNDLETGSIYNIYRIQQWTYNNKKYVKYFIKNNK